MCNRICSSNCNEETDCSNLKLLRSLSGRQQQGFTVSAGRQTNSINITNIYTFASVDWSSRWRTSKGKSHIRDGIIWNMALNQYIKHLNTRRVYKTKQAIVQSFRYCSLRLLRIKMNPCAHIQGPYLSDTYCKSLPSATLLHMWAVGLVGHVNMISEPPASDNW